MKGLHDGEHGIRLLRRMPPALEALIVLAICFGPAVVASLRDAIAPEGAVVFDNHRVILILLQEFLGFAFAGGLLYARGWRLSDVRVSFSLGSLGWGVLLYVLWVFASRLVISLTAALGLGPMQGYGVSVSSSLSPALLVMLLLVNPIYEELWFSAYPIERFKGFAAAVALGVSVVVRLLCHAHEGLAGAAAVGLLGVMSGLYYWRRRDLGAIVLAHFLADSIGLYSLMHR